MKKIYVNLILLLIMLSCCCEVFANDVGIKITNIENEICNYATENITYNSEISVNLKLLDKLAYKILEKENEINNDEIEKYKHIQKNVRLNVDGITKEVNVKISPEIKKYQDTIDNIILNINGIYCWIKPGEVLVNDNEYIEFKLDDTNNVIAEYTGISGINIAKKVNLFLSIVISLYTIILVFVVLNKLEFSTIFKKKTIYIFGILIVAFSLCYGITVYFADLSFITEKNMFNNVESASLLFDVNFEKQSSTNEIRGIYLGLPMFSEDFNSDYTTAWLRTEDTSKSDDVICGNYNTGYDVIKFPLYKSGSYYLKNNKKEFTDINDNSELCKSIGVLTARNVINGKTEKIYGVNDTLSRAEAVMILNKLFHIDKFDKNNEHFDDISASEWYAEFIIAGKDNDILSGYDDNTFKADNAITRQEFETVVGQIMETKLGYVLPENSDNLFVYSDYEEISNWAKKYISLLEREDIKIGGDKFEPNKFVTRGEAALLLYKVYCLIK